MYSTYLSFSEMEFSYTESDYVYNVGWKGLQAAHDLTQFDKELRSRWEQKMCEGRFKYPVSALKSRVVPGKMKYLVQLNEKRAIERRPPEIMESMNKPFNTKGFNFTKVKDEEILFRFCPNHSSKLSSEKTCGTNGTGNETISSVHSDSNCGNVKVNGHEIKECGRHILLINISPLEYGHILLVPDVDDCIPQRVTLKGMRLAVDLMLLSSHPGWRVGFNSLCGMASVNHQHMHAWYLEHRLLIETMKVNRVCDNLYEICDHPTTGFVFQLHGQTVEQFSRNIYETVNLFQQQEVAHNFVLTRGTRLDVSCDEDVDELCTVRAYVWPRKSQTVPIIVFNPTTQLPSNGTQSADMWRNSFANGHGNKNDKTDLKTYSAEDQVFNIAVAELGGYVPVYVAECFDTITEEYISNQLSAEMLPSDQYNNLKLQIQKLICHS